MVKRFTWVASRSLEEGAAAWDAAAIKFHGAHTTTNQSLGFLSAKAARVKLCRKAARVARNKVKEHQFKVMQAKMEALKTANTHEERRAILRVWCHHVWGRCP